MGRRCDGGRALDGGGGRMTTLDSRRPVTLDPADWTEFRDLGHRMIDDLVDHLAGIEHRDAWQPVPDEARAALDQPLPWLGTSAEAVYEDFLRYVRPYPRGNEHPRFWGWVNGSGLPLGILADLLAAGMNPSVGAFESAASLVEQQVLTWLIEMLGFPPGTSAVLTSGCSMSTIIGLAVARHARTGVDVRHAGLRAAGPLVSYASVEVHSSVNKAYELLGLGSDTLRRVRVDRDHRMDVDELARLVAADRRAGLQPLAAVATVGTVNTGAVDPLDGVAELCEREGIWLHVDGAFGALAWLVPELRPQLAGMQRADSLAFDLHKWLYLPYDIGCVLVRDAAQHHGTFAHYAEYLDSGMQWASPATCFPDLGVELTRRFRALKAWMCIKHHGVDMLADQVRLNIAHAAHLESLVVASDHLELLADRTLNVVCFRYTERGLSGSELDLLNQLILDELWASGTAVLSTTRIDGRFALRAAITNHRTRFVDLELVVAEIQRLGRRLGNGGSDRQASVGDAAGRSVNRSPRASRQHG
jgi:aromatic-L-amino-acid/L-tryptophan decarboxylase